MLDEQQGAQSPSPGVAGEGIRERRQKGQVSQGVVVIQKTSVFTLREMRRRCSALRRLVL